MAGSDVDHDLDFSGAGILGRLLTRGGLLKHGKKVMLIRVLIFIGITWLPLLVLSMMQNLAYGRHIDMPFVGDFATHIRFLLAAPIFLVGDRLLAPRLTRTMIEFVDRELLAAGQISRYRAQIRLLKKLNDSVAAEAIMIGAVAAAALLGLERAVSVKPGTWSYLESSVQNLSWAGWWLVHAAVPVWQFLVLRMLWRAMIYFNFLMQIARLDLKLIPIHPDRAGGLYFISIGHVSLLPFVFALSAVYASKIGTEIIYRNAAVSNFKEEIPAFAAAMLLFVLLPLVVFTPKLLRVKRNGLLRYGALAEGYVALFEGKWLGSEKPGGEGLLGSPDIQSLADLANSYNVIRSMRPIPCDRFFLAALGACILIPFLPLLLTAYTAREMLSIVRGVLF